MFSVICVNAEGSLVLPFVQGTRAAQGIASVMKLCSSLPRQISKINLSK
jgi:hypothetical protein